MSTDLTSTGPTSPGSADGGSAGGGFDRGRTTVSESVVGKLAARAATEVERATGSTRRFLGIPVGREPAASPARVDVDVDGEIASIRIAMSVHWPAPVRDVTRKVRDRVTEEVSSVTGLTVAEVDIDVTALVSSGGPGARRVV